MIPTTHSLIMRGAPVQDLAVALRRQPDLWNRDTERKYAPDSPHAKMADIWVRYNDRRPFDAGLRPWSEFNDLHESVWYPVAARLPEVRPIVFGLMARVQGERLGGVLITRLEPGGVIEQHVDAGWHAETFDKYFVAVDNPPGAVFQFPDGAIDARSGDVWWFRNDVPHAVVNDSDRPRIAMIVCIQHSKGPAWN